MKDDAVILHGGSGGREPGLKDEAVILHASSGGREHPGAAA